MPIPAYSGIPAPYARSSSGFISTSPGLLDSVTVTNGSTAGTYTFRDGSSTSPIRLVVGHAATTPAKRGTTSPFIGQGIHFTTKIYLVKTGSAQGAVLGGYKKYMT